MENHMDILDETTEHIPWQRLTTAYGRGTDIPRLIETRQYKALAELIEHQSTLWQVTPWVLRELLRDLKRRAPSPENITLDEIELYIAVASSFSGQQIGSGPGGEIRMNELLDESYLWPEDEEEDELQWEEEEPPGYGPEPFFGYYYFSYLLLKQAEPVFATILNSNQELAPAIRELQSLLHEAEAD
ncbi:hypothetical protein ACM1RC_16705 [Paenibacillus azoreducens]|uniref:hypothetical protein n=1 Tax=Paenibacillus azoreducens TaxID=116718 RepID=UPI0039F52813